MKTLISHRQALVLAIALVAGIGVGCKKKADTEGTGQPAETQTQALSASKLPGANDVMAALDRKDYGAVIRGIAAAQQAAGTSPELRMEFATLVDEVKMRLLEEAPSDPKAKETLTALRQITGGR